MPNITEYDDQDQNGGYAPDADYASPGNHEWSHEVGQPAVLTVGRKKYAYGLRWVAAPSATNAEMSRDAKAECAQGRGDLYCMIAEGSFGIGSRVSGQRVGMRSLAGCIYDAFSTDLIAALPIDGGGYYLLGVREGSVLEHSDVIVATEDEARGFIEDHISIHNWSILAPSEWDIADSHNDTILSLVDKSRTKTVLLDATSKTRNRNLIFVAVVIMLAAGGYYAYQDYQDGLEQDRIAREAAQKKKDAHAKRQAAIKADSEKDWPFDSTPVGVWSISACESAMLAVPTLLPGYDFKAVACNPDTMHVVTRFQAKKDQSAVYSDVPAYLNMQTSIPHHIQHSGQIISVDYDFSNMLSDAPLYPKHDKTTSVRKEWSYLDTTFDRMHRSDALKAFIEEPKISEVEEKRAKSKKKNDQIPITVFRKLKIQITGVIQPSSYNRILSPLKAFTIQSVQYDPEKGVWTMSGTAFESVLKAD